jgi:hypothetical protein
LTRDVTIAGLSYYLTMQPPTNAAVIASLESADYLHAFYPIDRSWSEPIDSGDLTSSANQAIVDSLAGWRSWTQLEYGVVDYHNMSAYAAVALDDLQHFAANFEHFTQGRPGLYAYMHPIERNPGPRRLTNALLAELPWRNRRSILENSEHVTRQYFARRYGSYHAAWREVTTLMSQSVSNAKEMFGDDSLYTVLFHHVFWKPPLFDQARVPELIERFRLGQAQVLPSASTSSGGSVKRATFLGLNDSLRLHEQAKAQWTQILAEPLRPDIRRRMLDDVEWFEATASRYRLMAATCDYVVARLFNLAMEDPRERIDAETQFLATTPVTADTLSPITQRHFLRFHRELAELP